VFLEVRTREHGCNELKFIADELKEKGDNAQKTLIFVQSINKTTELLLWFREQQVDYGRVYFEGRGFEYNSEMYSGCTHEISKARIADEFSKSEGKVKVLVATVAFGMGINIRSLKQVVVYDIPKWPTTLMQMIGRCSRDNEKGRCIIFLPVVPTNGTLGFEMKSKCPRRTLLEKLCGPEESKVDMSSEPCKVDDCTCKRCTCCSFCKKH
jgi:superfamily II DNA helicase RecQ